MTSSTPAPAAGSTVVSSASPWVSSRSLGSPSVRNTARLTEKARMANRAQRRPAPTRSPTLSRLTSVT